MEKRPHVGGYIYTEETAGIQGHNYGSLIFHRSNERVWIYMNRFATFNRYTNSPVAKYKDELYNMPFNMNTFHAMWGIRTPQEAKEEIQRQNREAGITSPVIL